MGYVQEVVQPSSYRFDTHPPRANAVEIKQKCPDRIFPSRYLSVAEPVEVLDKAITMEADELLDLSEHGLSKAKVRWCPRGDKDPDALLVEGKQPRDSQGLCHFSDSRSSPASGGVSASSTSARLF